MDIAKLNTIDISDAVLAASAAPALSTQLASELGAAFAGRNDVRRMAAAAVRAALGG